MDNHEEFLKHVVASKDRFLARVGPSTVVLLVTHHDADGISAGAIVASALHRHGIPFQARVVKQLSEKTLQEVGQASKQGRDSLFVFTDLGSGQLRILARLLPARDVLVLDHHEPDTEAGKDFESTAIHVNPWQFGIDGSTDVSGAGVAYFFARALDERNVDLSPLAITGALGDMQDKGERSSLSGLNRRIVEEGTTAGLFTEGIDIKVFGRFSRPIHLALTYTTDPFIPGLSGDETACVLFLQKIKIPLKHPGSEKPRTIADLTREEKSMLVSAIIEWALKHGMNPAKTRNIIGTIYIAAREDPDTNLKDLREFASVLNSCGRLGQGGIGMAIAMGDRKDALAEGQQLINEYRKRISNYLEWVRSAGAIKKRDAMHVIEGEDYVDDTMIGTLASMIVSAQDVPQDRPVIAWARIKATPGMVKVSARAFAGLVEKGLNLSTGIRETLKEIGIDSPGGGHAPAAGCEVPEAKLDRFLKVLGRKVTAQLQLDQTASPTPRKTPSWY